MNNEETQPPSYQSDVHTVEAPPTASTNLQESYQNQQQKATSTVSEYAYSPQILQQYPELFPKPTDNQTSTQRSDHQILESEEPQRYGFSDLFPRDIFCMQYAIIDYVRQHPKSFACLFIGSFLFSLIIFPLIKDAILRLELENPRRKQAQ